MAHSSNTNVCARLAERVLKLCQRDSDMELREIAPTFREDVGEKPVETDFVPSKTYATRKTIAQGALDLALLMANASQLKALVDIPSNHRGNFYVPMLALIGVSIALQVVTGLVLVILGFMDPKTEVGHRRAENMNNSAVVLILVITILNIFISAFGISYTDESKTP